MNTSIAPIGYATTGATGASFTGLPTGVSGSFASNAVVIDGTPNTSGTFNYTVTLTGGCGNTVANGLISVNQTPTLSGVSQAATICNGSAATINLTGLVANSTATVSYTINGAVQTPVGVTADASGKGNFATPTLTAANNGQTLQITGIAITSATPNCSATFAQNATLMVNSCPPVTQFYVNDNSTSGDSYTAGVGDDANPGTQALPFATIAKAISAAAAGSIIYVDAGTYNEDVYVNKTLLIKGAGEILTVIKGTYAGTNNGSAAILFMAASNATVKNLTITRDYGTTLNDWYNSPKNQGVSVAQSTTGVTLDSVTVRDQRNAVYINNAQNFVLTNNTIRDSRTGVHFVNNVSGAQIFNNNIVNNFTHGVLFNFDPGPLKMTNVKVNDNNISGNWYSQINMQAASAGANLADMTGFSMTCNWYGTPSPDYSATPAGGPSYTAQAPSQFGGTDPNEAADIKGNNAAYAPYNPFLINGTDNSAAQGFQPVPGSCGTSSLSASITSQTNVDCSGNSTGSVTVTGSGGTGTYQYSKDGTIYQSSGTFSNLAAGNYTVTVKDGEGNTTTQAINILEPTAVALNTTKMNVNCNGGNNGSINATASGGTGTYTYSISGPGANVSNQTNGTFNNLSAGTYNLMATDANGCTVSANVTITQPSGTVPDVIVSLADYTDNLFAANGSESTLVFQVFETGGNPALNALLRITKQSGYNFSLVSGGTATTTTGTYTLDNSRWTADYSDPNYFRITLGSGQQINCQSSVYIGIKITRATPSKSVFNLTGQIRSVTNETNLSNNNTSFQLVAQ